MADARKTAVKALVEVLRDGAYSNITLNKALSEGGLQGADRALASALFYGVLDRQITLDYVLSKFLTKPLKRLSPYTAQVLRTALYQIMYMERIPDSAAVNEAVKLIKASNERFNAGFVNGVLRNILRQGIKLPEGEDKAALSVRYSCPEAIIGSFIKDYGLDTAVKILEAMLDAPPVVLQPNPTRVTSEELAEKLLGEGTAADINDDGSLTVSGGIDVRASGCYKNGLFHIQDNASKRAVAALAPESGERVLDLCAAPGGKSFTAAGMMKGKGEILSFDLYEKRVALIAEGAKRLGFENIRTAVGDATVFDPALGKFDAVICDVPCSGLGVLRRKPEIKYKNPDDWKALPPLQLKILENAAAYTAVGGRLMYSTCTLRKSENEKLTKAFLDKNPCFALKYEHTYMPHTDGTDGFYCAVLVKKG